jgi:catechol 2,3-dioxygenase-like lactoylglutathione lyase family enzyme
MNLRGFATINYWADDVTAAAAWYTELLGVEPYFQRPGPDGALAYAEFRIGDNEAELGLVSRAFAPPGLPSAPGGALMYWHVDDLEGMVARLIELGATEYQPITPRRPRLRHRGRGGPVREHSRGHVQPALRGAAPALQLTDPCPVRVTARPRARLRRSPGPPRVLRPDRR